MSIDTEDNYSKSFEILDDLKCLLHRRDQLFVDGLNYHLSELHRKSKELDSLDEFTFLKDLLAKQVNDILRDALLYLPNAFNLHFYQSENIPAHAWNNLLFAIPQMVYLVNIFDLIGDIEVNVKSHRFEIIGDLNENVDLEKIAQECYAVTRSFLSKEMILTFSISKGLRGGDRISLNLDYSCDGQKYLKFNMSKYDLHLYFAGCLGDYQLSLNKLDSIGQHLCLEITDDLSVKRLNTIPLEIKESMNSKDCPFTILHFSFLFRSVSIIIPSRGIVADLPQRGKSMKEFQNENDFFQFGPASFYLDFFSLISN